MIGNYLKVRRATNALAEAMRNKNLEDMRYAISQGANLAKVSDTFDEPGQMFMMSYEVSGALELAVEHRLPIEAFEMLLEAGAPVPTKFGDRPHPEALFNHDDILWAQADAVIALVKQHHAAGRAEPPPLAPRRRGMG